MTVDLPEIEEIRKVTFSPGDVVVVRFRGPANLEQLSRARDMLRGTLPAGVGIIVLDRDARFDVMTPA